MFRQNLQANASRIVIFWIYLGLTHSIADDFVKPSFLELNVAFWLGVPVRIWLVRWLHKYMGLRVLEKGDSLIATFLGQFTVCVIAAIALEVRDNMLLALEYRGRS